VDRRVRPARRSRAAAAAGSGAATATPSGTQAAPPATATGAVRTGQTFGGSSYGVNPTAVDDSVDSYTGALETSHTDIRVAGIGVPFALTREYNSGDVSFVGAFGPGWSTILDLAVKFSSTGARATVYGADGQQVGFTYQASNNSWVRDPGVRTSLSCSGPATNGKPPSTCTVTRFSDGSHWTLAAGYVQSFVAADGQGLKFAYASSPHRINAVTVDTTASTPLVIHLTRNSSGRVTKLSTPTRSVSYTYDSAGDLSTVTDPAARSWRMTYQSGHLLNKVAAYSSATATSGTTTLTAAYNVTVGRVSSVTENAGTQLHNTTFLWTAGSPAYAQRAELVDVNGTIQRAYYTDIYQNGEIIEHKDPLGHATFNTWNSDLDLVTVKNPLGSTETMTYDSSGDQLTDTQTLNTAGDTSKSTYAYDSHHRLTSASKVITSSLTDTATYTYNSLNELASSSLSGSGTTTYAYNSRGLMSSKTDAAGNVTTYTYDAAGNLTGESVKQSSGATPQGKGPLYGYDEAGDKVLSVPAVGNQGGGSYVSGDATTMTYSPDAQETSVTAPGGAITSTTYAPDGVVSSSTDAAGNKTTYSWSSVTVPGGTLVKKTTVGPAGTTVDLYDHSGNVISSTPPQPSSTVSGKPSGVVTNTYNAASQMVSTTNGQGVATNYTLDAAGDTVSTASRGATTTATYNLVGWATGTSTTTRSYPSSQDTSGGDWTADTTHTKTTYDVAGDLLSKTDAAGGTTTYTYVAGDRVGSITTASGATKYAYDALGDKTSVTSPGGGVTSYVYDALGRETKQTIGSQNWTIAYDADGNPIRTVDPDGRTANYTYDASNRKTGVAYSWAAGHTGAEAGPIQWLYNKLGERTAMIDSANGSGANGTTHTYTYDNRGRLVKEETDQNGCSFNCTSSIFKYDYSTPNQLKETYPDGAVITYRTDDGGNLMSVSVPAQSDGSPKFQATSTLPNTLVTQGSSSSATAGTSSNAMSSMTPSGTMYPDGQFGYKFNEPSSLAGHTTFATGEAFYSAALANSASSSSPDPPQGAYEAQADTNGNLLEELWHALPDSSNIRSSMAMDYGYNGAGVELPVSESSGAGVRLTSYQSDYSTSASSTTYYGEGSYTYNAAGQPTSISTSSGTTTGTTTVKWTLGYATNGEINSVSTTAPNPSNTGSAPTFAYDNAGNLTSADVQPPYQAMTQAGKQWTFAYNDAGQLATATQVGGDQIVYSYDGDGNITTETDTRNGTSLGGYALTWDPRSEVPQLAEADYNGGFHQRYFWGNGALGMEEGATGGHNGTAYVFHDNQAGTPTMVTNTSGRSAGTIFDDPYGNFVHGTTSSFTFFPDMLIGFDGSFTDPNTGLDLMGSRWYDPNLGMFMSRPSATAPATGSSSVGSGASSTTSEGMSASPGTSPSMPVSPAATSFTFAADDPTGEAQPTGSSLAPAVTGTMFAGTSGSNSSASLYATVKPFVSGPLAATLVKAPAKLAYKAFTGQLSQTAPAAAQSAAGTESAMEGSTLPEETTLEAQAGNDATDLTSAAQAEGASVGESAGKLGLGKLVTVASFSYSAYQAGQTCANYGVVSLQCAGAALGTAISFGAEAACEALTAGVGTVACGIVQSVLAQVIPLIVTGDGQAFLDSVTVSSSFNIGNAETLAAQVFIAYELGPIGAAALLGEVIYANWSSIENAFVAAGNAIVSALETAGTAFLNGVEEAGGAIVSGISTAAEEISSGISALASVFTSLDFGALGDAFSSLGSDAAYVADSIGSALCDFVSSIDCFFSGARTTLGRGAHTSSSAGALAGSGGGSRGSGQASSRLPGQKAVGVQGQHAARVLRLKRLNLARLRGSPARAPALSPGLPGLGQPALSP
jgi:YD repeat-containing protein